MPRLKVIKKPEDGKTIPQDQAVTVDLTPEPAPDSAEQITAREDAAKAAEVAKSQEPDQSEQIVSLQKQLEDLKKANEEARKAQQEYAQQVQTARQEVQSKSAEIEKIGTRAEQAEYDAVLNALGAAQAEADSARQSLKTAGESQDWDAIAEANMKLARASGRLVQLEDGKALLENRRERAAEEAKTQREQPKTTVVNTVEAHIDSIPNLSVAQRTWLKAHPELMSNTTKNIKLQNAHIEAEEANHSPGSDSYFKFIEERLGYRKPEAQEEEEDAIESQRPPIVSAPPSRDNVSASTGRVVNNNRITLSAEQREAARNAGINEVEYAKNLIKLNEAKKQGNYQ